MISLMPPTDNAQKRHVQHSVHPHPLQTASSLRTWVTSPWKYRPLPGQCSAVINTGIFNTDQGVQFTSGDFIDELAARGVRISMDGKGRFLDNIFIERLWRSLKYEEV